MIHHFTAFCSNLQSIKDKPFSFSSIAMQGCKEYNIMIKNSKISENAEISSRNSHKQYSNEEKKTLEPQVHANMNPSCKLIFKYSKLKIKQILLLQ